MRDAVLLGVCALILAAFTALTLAVGWVAFTGRGVLIDFASPDAVVLLFLWLGWFHLLRAIAK